MDLPSKQHSADTSGAEYAPAEGVTLWPGSELNNGSSQDSGAGVVVCLGLSSMLLSDMQVRLVYQESTLH